ncbi:MAG: hypothetical protein U1F06_00785 [Steroidobacteraceae bacterium]
MRGRDGEEALQNLAGSGRRRIARKSMIWMSSRVSPPLASRTTSARRARPGMKRSSPMRSSGPLGTSRMPVASTTMAPGRPSAKRRYQSSTCWLTWPSPVARHGTIAGTQVRAASASGPAATGLNSRDAAASAAVGQRPGRASKRICCRFHRELF